MRTKNVAQFNGFCWCCLCACSFAPDNARGELAQRGGVVECCANRYELQLATIKAMSRRGTLFDALHRISAEPVSISQDPSVNRDDAIERVTRRGLPKHGVAGVVRVHGASVGKTLEYDTFLRCDCASRLA